MILASVLFLYPVSDTAIPVFVPETESLHMLSEFIQEDKPPLILLHWSEGIFFDTETNKIHIPKDTKYEIEYNRYRQRFAISFEDIEFANNRLSLLPYDILPLRIFSENNQLTIHTRQWAYIANENEYIQIIDPRERYRTIVVLDAGHGGNDPGAGRIPPYESEIVLAVSQKIIEIFDRPDILIIPTRTCDYFLTTAARTNIANSIGDYFISIHCNADSQSSLSRGTLTLFGTADGSEELAEAFQTALVTALGSQDRGIHYAPQFHIPRESNIPVILLELLFLSNPQDAASLADPEIQLLIAKTIADEIKKL
jgi:N-acetylmuramoyl-L-alanine amidase